MHLPYPRLLVLSLGLALAATTRAQTAVPAADTTAAPAPAAASGTAPARGGRGNRPPPAPPVIPALQPWDRPADGKALFAEDFESGAISDKIWSVIVAPPATAAVQSDMVAHGKYALKITYPAGSSRDYAFIAMTVPEALRDHFYGRAYMYISGVPDPHSVFMSAGSTGFPSRANWLEIGGYTGHFQPSLQITDPTDDKPRGEVPAFQGTLPIGRWFCLEFEVNDKPDRIVIWVDGKLDVNIPFAYNKITNPAVAKDTGLIGGFFEFALGYRTFAQGTLIPKDINIYYDDIAIGDKPIGQLAPVAATANSTAVNEILRNQALSMVLPANSVNIPPVSSAAK